MTTPSPILDGGGTRDFVFGVGAPLEESTEESVEESPQESPPE